jgi:hypothetical protein
MVAILALAILAPPLLAAGPDDPSPFGIVCPWPKVGETGARWVRCGAGATQLVDWSAVEPAPGQFKWDAADAELAQFDKPEGLTPLPILAYTAPWASSGPNGDRACPPTDLRFYARFVYESVARYKGDIKYWEVWNEPNIGFFAGSIPQYVDLLKAASIAARQADPDCHILFGGMAGVDLRFARRCYEHGAAPYFDVMACHPYQWGRTFNDGWFAEKLTNLQTLMRECDGRRKPVWLTEIGWSTGEGVSNEDQARLLVQSYVSALSLADLNVAKVFWFCVKDWGGPGHGLFADDGARKPAFGAYRALTQELEGRMCVGKVKAGEVRAYLFGAKDKDDTVRLVFWAPALEPLDFELPVAQGPLTLVNLQGEESTIQPAPALKLKAEPAPSYLRLPPADVAALPLERRVESTAYCTPPRMPSPPPTWASVQVPRGTSRLWLVPGREQPVDVVLWNLAREPRRAALRLRLFGQTYAAGAELPAFDSATVTVKLTPPGDAKPGLEPLQVELSTGRAENSRTELPVRIAAGPTVEFFGNSFVEGMYLQPGGKSGCSESCRFGRDWSYLFEVPAACTARVGAFLGAHQGGPFALHWTQGNQEEQALFEGRGDREWREAVLPNLHPGKLYLRVSGTDVQLEELVVTWEPPR